MKAARIVIGLLLLCAALAGAVHGVRAAVAQAVYLQTKFAGVSLPLDAAASACRRAASLYPWNYRFSAWVAQEAWNQRCEAPGCIMPERVEMAREFCAEALALNPFKRDVRLLEARLLALDSPVQAAECWETYAEWHYWSPFNQAMRVKFLADAGDFDGALRALDLLRGRPMRDYAERALRRAWAREMAPPSLAPHEDGKATP